MQEFNKIGRKLPYRLEEGQLEILKERCKASTTQKQSVPTSSWRASAISICRESILGRQYILWATSAAAICIIVVGTTFLKPADVDSAPDSFEALMESVDYDTLQQFADNDYDDIGLNIY